jgi:hypothetical protein
MTRFKYLHFYAGLFAEPIGTVYRIDCPDKDTAKLIVKSLSGQAFRRGLIARSKSDKGGVDVWLTKRERTNL